MLVSAINLMKANRISQVPVIDGENVVGSLNETSLMRLLHQGEILEEEHISDYMGKPLPSLDENTDISEAYRVLLSGSTGIIVKRAGKPVGFISRMDLVNHFASEKKQRGEVQYGI